MDLLRNSDVEFKFRQESNFFWLSGINEPDYSIYINLFIKYFIYKLVMDNIPLHPNHSIPIQQRTRIHITRALLTFLKKLFRKINLNCKKILILYTTLCIGIIEYACMLIMHFQPRTPIRSVWIKEATDIIHDTGRQERK